MESALFGALVAGGIGGLLNLAALPLLGSGVIWLGGVTVLPLAWRFGAGWGALAAAIAFNPFIPHGHNGGPLVFFVAEAAAVGWLVASRGTAPWLASLRCWLVGAPVAGLVFGIVPRLPFPVNWIEAASYPASGLLAALVASSLHAWWPDRWRMRPGAAGFHGPLAQVLFRRFAALVILPLLFVAVLAGGAFERHARDHASGEIAASAHDIASQLDAFLREHQRAVITMADTLDPQSPPERIEGALFQLRRRYPALHLAAVLDAGGAAVASSPAVAVPGRPLAGVVAGSAETAFRSVLRSKQPFLGEVVPGRTSRDPLVVTIAAPSTRAGRVRAVVMASMNFARLADSISALTTVRGRTVLVADSAGRVVLAIEGGTVAPLVNSGTASLHAAAEGAEGSFFFHDPNLNDPDRGERLLAAKASAGLSGWTVYLEEPWSRTLRVIAGFYGGTLVAVGFGLLATLALARRAARAITAPLRDLSGRAHALALGQPGELRPIVDAPEEVGQIAGEVERAAQQLAAANLRLTSTLAERDRLNGELTRTLHQLDATVRERTAALANKNSELTELFETQRTAQLELAESDHRYRSVLESLAQVVFETDALGQWSFLSPAWKRLTGYESSDTLGRSALNYFHPDDHNQVRSRLLPTVELLGDDAVPRVRCRGADGIYRWVEIAARPTVRRPGMAGTLTDVTESIERETALRLSRERFEVAVRGSGAGLWDWELATGTIYFSPRTREILGYRGDELANTLRVWRGLVHREDRRRIWLALRAHVLGRSPMFEEECRLRHRDGSWCWILTRGAVSRDERGRPRRMAGSVTDISELKRTQAELEERSNELSAANAQLARAARLKDEFLASMSHELRTPLNSVLGMSEVMLEGIPGPVNQAQRDGLRTIQDSGRHLLELINDLLDLSKIEAGKLTLDRGPVVITELVQACLRFVKEPAQKKSLRLNEAYQQRARVVIADSRRLKQILLNLLSNAVKFTPDQGRVGLEVAETPDGGAITFTVWDNGIGIPAAEQTRLFQPFVQVDSTLSRKFGGTGLGLAIVRRLAELHGGGVSLESTVGVGSRFTVALPLEEALSETPVLETTAIDEAYWLDEETPRLRVLLVEDHEETVLTYTKYLEAHRCEVRVAHQGHQALELARATPPEVIVLDLQMPGIDGLSTLRHLREDERTAKIPVLTIAALNMPGDRDRCLAAGASAFLTKPVRLRTLLSLLRQHARGGALNGAASTATSPTLVSPDSSSTPVEPAPAEAGAVPVAPLPLG